MPRLPEMRCGSYSLQYDIPCPMYASYPRFTGGRTQGASSFSRISRMTRSRASLAMSLIERPQTCSNVEICWSSYSLPAFVTKSCVRPLLLSSLRRALRHSRSKTDIDWLQTHECSRQKTRSDRTNAISAARFALPARHRDRRCASSTSTAPRPKSKQHLCE